MIEKKVLEYLNSTLPVRCFSEVPRSSPHERYIVVEKTGSRTENMIETSTIAVQSYAETMYEAAELNADVKEVMEAFEETQGISMCQLNSDYNFTDMTVKGYRYQAVFEIVEF